MWHLPTVCPPDSATMARSSKPFGWKIARRWSTPLSPSGRRPLFSAMPSLELFASGRPNLVGTSGPPINLMATFAASAHKSAFDMRSGTYFFDTSPRSAKATVGNPALAAQVPSPASVKRIAAFGQPPLPFIMAPASCHDKRTRMGPQLFVLIKASRSATRCAYVIALPTTRPKVSFFFNSSCIAAASPRLPFTSRMASPTRSFASMAAKAFQVSARPPVTAVIGSRCLPCNTSTWRPSSPPLAASKVTE
mmetsp:Transcript_118430/g.342438  ORF Transcript_118430/g.342438 Transcript_118430/m.342438 type:complete len:250 (+) Transcript_118430:693-1442(+)